MSAGVQQDAMVEAAFAVLEHAYAPYSRFRVGAALETASGEIFTGCNVENSAFPAGLCAERNALVSAVAAGHRAFRRVVVATEAREPTPPCGLCRQALVEFAQDLEVVSTTRSGASRRWMLGELLPSPFTTASLSGA